MSNLLPIIDKPADFTRLANAKAAKNDPGHYIRSVNGTFNWLIDQLRAEKQKNKRLREKIKQLIESTTRHE